MLLWYFSHLKLDNLYRVYNQVYVNGQKVPRKGSSKEIVQKLKKQSRVLNISEPASFSMNVRIY